MLDRVYRTVPCTGDRRQAQHATARLGGWCAHTPHTQTWSGGVAAGVPPLPPGPCRVEPNSLGEEMLSIPYASGVVSGTKVLDCSSLPVA